MTNVKSDKSLSANIVEEFPLKIPDVATILNVHSNTVRRMVKKRLIKHAFIGKQVRFKRRWVNEYVKRQTKLPKRDRSAKK